MADEMRGVAQAALLRALAAAGCAVQGNDPSALLLLARFADDLARELRDVAADYVVEAKLMGASWTDVGDAFGVSRQWAFERFVGRTQRRR